MDNDGFSDFIFGCFANGVKAGVWKTLHSSSSLETPTILNGKLAEPGLRHHDANVARG